MMHYRTTMISGFVTLATLAVPASAATIPWTVREVDSAGTPIKNVADASALLSGQIASSNEATGQFNTINFNELSTPLGGKFPGDVSFPGTSSGHTQDFATEVTGAVRIPRSGNYSFGVSSDDGFILNIGPFTSTYPGLRAPGETYATFTFPKAGDYPVDLIYFQHTIRAELEFFATPGNYTAVGEAGSNFQLVGDTANGGLRLVASTPSVGTSVPEPSSLTMLVPLTLGLLRRRR